MLLLERTELGPHHEPLSCNPVQTLYGCRMSADAWYASPTDHMRTASHFKPPSQLTSTPPSLPYITWLLLSGSIQIAWLSTWPMLFRPCQVRPPSSDLVGPTPPRYTTSG